MDKHFPEIFFLAPMAELTTPALRQVVKDFSPNVIMFSEMLSAGAIVSGASRNEPLMSKYSFDDPYIFQILGNSATKMADACRILSQKGCYSIDINMGCSAPIILKKGFGAGLLTDINLAGKIIHSCRKATPVKLSVKMRTGFNENNRANLLDFINVLKDEGVDFITVHPRHAKLSFKRNADWSLIKFIKENINIPVIGNGDLTDPVTAIKKMEENLCDGIMIGREAVKTPWIFKACNELATGNKTTQFSVNVHEIFLKILEHIENYLPQYLHKSRGHRFCFYFSKNAKFSHDLFRKIRNVDDINSMKNIIDDYYNRNREEKIKNIYYRKKKRKQPL